MEYLVLARKWRPQFFEDVLGQEHVVRTLSNAITQERIAHAFLFSGPRGVGKTSIARILAKALNCEQGPTPNPCNKCVHCREITDGIAMDIREIDGASNRGIDEIRELRENVKFAPSSCRYKVYIIDEVHMLTREAFNALLKTLEEPPAHVIFIFATTETHKVPATILSRCQCFDFRRIPPRLIAENLRKIALAEGIKISDTGLAWIAEAGDGSLRDSQSIFDQVISYDGFAIADKAIEELLGRSDRRFLFLLSEAVLARDAGRCLKIIDDAYYAGLDMKFFYQTLLGHFRNLLLVGIAGNSGSLVDLPADEVERLTAQTSGASRETLQRYLEILMAEEENVRRSLNARLNIEALLCRMAWLEPLIPIDEVLSRMEKLERRLGESAGPQAGGVSGEIARSGNLNGGRGGAVSETNSRMHINSATLNARPDGENQAGVSGGALPLPVERQPEGQFSERRAEYRIGDAAAPGGGWGEFTAFVKRQDAALSAKIESAKCIACDEGRLRIGFVKGYLFRDDVDAGKATIESLAGRFFGRTTLLEIETLAPDEAAESQNGNGPNGRAAKNHRIQEIRRKALSHPLVMKVLDVFPQAEVREVRLREVVAIETTTTATPLTLIPDAYEPSPLDELAPPDEERDEERDEE